VKILGDTESQRQGKGWLVGWLRQGRFQLGPFAEFKKKLFIWKWLDIFQCILTQFPRIAAPPFDQLLGLLPAPVKLLEALLLFN